MATIASVFAYVLVMVSFAYGYNTDLLLLFYAIYRVFPAGLLFASQHGTERLSIVIDGDGEHSKVVLVFGRPECPQLVQVSVTLHGRAFRLLFEGLVHERWIECYFVCAYGGMSDFWRVKVIGCGGGCVALLIRGDGGDGVNGVMQQSLYASLMICGQARPPRQSSADHLSVTSDDCCLDRAGAVMESGGVCVKRSAEDVKCLASSP